MPRSAMATGMVDWVLNVTEMPARILQYLESEALLRLPTGDGPQPGRRRVIPAWAWYVT